MTRQIDFAGQSGQTYRYKALEDLRPLSPGGGNFLYVRGRPSGQPTVLYAGETDSLQRGVLDRWPEAQSSHGATDIYVRLNFSGDVRRTEQADLAEKHAPPMNGDGGGAPTAGPGKKRTTRGA